MNRRWIIVGIVALVAMTAAWFLMRPAPLPNSLSTILRGSSEFELLSIGPYPHEGEPLPESKLFRRYRIHGSTKITDGRTKGYLITTLERAVPEGAPGACFEPRHGIRATYKGEVYDLLICFSCGHVNALKGEVKISEFLVGHRHQAPFDKVLTDAGVKLAPQ